MPVAESRDISMSHWGKYGCRFKTAPAESWELADHTFEPEGHLDLEHLKVLGHARLGLGAHLLARPLEGAVDLLCDPHRGRDPCSVLGYKLGVSV